MKILISKRNAEQCLADELSSHCIDALLPVHTVRVRVSRKSNKRIDKQRYIMRRIVFADVDASTLIDLNGRLKWMQRIWILNGAIVDVPDVQVHDFINEIGAIDKPVIKTTYKTGDKITISSGPFVGFDMIVTSIFGNKISGLIDGMNCPITLPIDKI